MDCFVTLWYPILGPPILGPQLQVFRTCTAHFYLLAHPKSGVPKRSSPRAISTIKQQVEGSTEHLRSKEKRKKTISIDKRSLWTGLGLEGGIWPAGRSLETPVQIECFCVKFTPQLCIFKVNVYPFLIIPQYNWVPKSTCFSFCCSNLPSTL